MLTLDFDLFDFFDAFESTSTILQHLCSSSYKPQTISIQIGTKKLQKENITLSTSANWYKMSGSPKYYYSTY